MTLVDQHAMNFAEQLVRIFSTRGNQLAVVDHQRAVTYQDLADNILIVATWLRNKEIQPGQRVIFASDNCIEWPAIFYGCIYIGAIPVPISPEYSDKEFDSIKQLIDPVIIIDQTLFSEIFSTLSKPVPVHKFGPNDLAFITMTSGSTAHTKAVMHGHARFQKFVDFEGLGYVKFSSTRRIVFATKFYFAWGLANGVICALALGSQIFVTAGLNPKKVIEQINQNAASDLFIVPTVARLLVSYLQIKKISIYKSLQIYSGGEIITKELGEILTTLFGKPPLNSIGTTETGGYCGQVPGNSQLGSAGRYWIGSSVRIVNNHGQDCDLFECGEIYVYAHNPTLGYWGDSKATTETYVGAYIRTRDLGHFDQDNNLVFLGRLNDSFKINGIMYYSADIEQQILSVPGITDVAVVAVEDQNKFNLMSLQIYVCVDNHRANIKQQIQQTVKIVSIKTSQINIIDEIPRTVTQKKAKWRLTK